MLDSSPAVDEDSGSGGLGIQHPTTISTTMNLGQGSQGGRLHLIGVFASAFLVACSSAGPSSDASNIRLSTVPTSPEYISGGDALIRMEASADIDLSTVAVRLNGQEVSGEFVPAPPDPLGREMNARLALLTGLGDGTNEVVATLDGDRLASLTITNYPATGPIFSGPQLEPYFCLDQIGEEPGSARFAIGNGDFIEGPPAGPGCAYPTRVDFVYRTADGPDWLPLPDPNSIPVEADQVTTSTGRSVPFVVRIETGSLNRAIYQTAVLVDPTADEPSPFNPPSGWNGRLIYTFGGGCEAGFFQGASTGGVLRESMLAAGYAVASSTLNVNAQGGCNDPLSAETAMMVKERFAETYGPPVHTIGNGGSGGAMQQLLIAGAYPGILDGILPSLTFPDAVSYLIDSIECYPLRTELNGAGWDTESKRVVGGWADWETCNESLGDRPNRASPYDCPSQIPVSDAYDGEDQPAGVRCSVYDGMRNVFGRVEGGGAGGLGFARNPHGNIGVQYGLQALREGLLSKEQFLEINERIGGWDIDWNRTVERTPGDPIAAQIAYETGRITSGTGGLATTPIIDERSYLDDIANFHTSYYSFVMRDRLIRDLGSADHYVLQRHGRDMSLADENIQRMDEWLTNLALDSSRVDRMTKMARTRPASLVDACWDAEGNRVAESQDYDESKLYDNTAGQCNTLFKPHTGPRMVAGGPLSNDVLICQLKPLARGDYSVEFTDAEWARMQRTFPSGVCDWSKDGVGQVEMTGTWLSFGPSPVNRYEPPTSVAGAGQQ